MGLLHRPHTSRCDSILGSSSSNHPETNELHCDHNDHYGYFWNERAVLPITHVKQDDDQEGSVSLDIRSTKIVILFGRGRPGTASSFGHEPEDPQSHPASNIVVRITIIAHIDARRPFTLKCVGSRRTCTCRSYLLQCSRTDIEPCISYRRRRTSCYIRTQHRGKLCSVRC